MDAKKLVALRKEAEKAVSEMPDGEIKVKAFEVILRHLLTGGREEANVAATDVSPRSRKTKAVRSNESKDATSATGRILVLRDEGFFKNQKTLGEVRQELRAHGWHYALHNLSGRIQRLVQKKQLSRELVAQGKKKVWKYSNR